MPVKPLEVACPTCARRLPWSQASPWRPFCSQRCRLIDLGEWLSEERCIATASPEDFSPDSEGADQAGKDI